MSILKEEFVFYSRYETGHRLEYIKFSERYLGGERVFSFFGLFSRKPLLFLMIEESFFLYVLVALLRSILGRRTVGLVFRVRECLERRAFKLKVKYFILFYLKKNKHTRSLSILPFNVMSGAGEICDGWIYDFQFWDREFLESLTIEAEVKEVVLKIQKTAAGRRVICAIGKQDESKGFDEFVRLYLGSKALQEQYLFVSGGKVLGISDALLDQFEYSGGLLLNKRITDSELVGLYRASDIIWACYSPKYDQSSGIFGRALQYDKTIIVRESSIIGKLAEGIANKYIGARMPCCLGVVGELLKLAIPESGAGNRSLKLRGQRSVLLGFLFG